MDDPDASMRTEKRKHPIPTPETLRRLLRYEPETGKLFWRERSVYLFTPSKHRTADHKMNNWNSKCAGKEAFTAVDHRGCKQGRIFDKGYLAHRVIWATVVGEWPKEEIDHEDGNPSNNRWTNLRAVPHIENMRNRVVPKHSTSGVCGVTKGKRRGTWTAQIGVDGSVVCLGTFSSLEAAAAARTVAERRYGFHENHGRKRRE